MGFAKLEFMYARELQDIPEPLIEVYKAEDWQLSQIEILLNTSTFDDEQKNYIEGNLDHYSQEEAFKIIENLQQNQIDQVDSGFNYNQTDINNKLNKIV